VQTAAGDVFEGGRLAKKCQRNVNDKVESQDLGIVEEGPTNFAPFNESN
jgi:hypothetical protein